MIDWRLYLGWLINPRKDKIAEAMYKWRKKHRYIKDICDCSNMSAIWYKKLKTLIDIFELCVDGVKSYDVYIVCTRKHAFLLLEKRVGDKKIKDYYDPVFAAKVNKFVEKTYPWKGIEFVGSLEEAKERYGGDFDEGRC